MKRKTIFPLATIVILTAILASGIMVVLADDGTTTDAIAGTWYGNMHFSSSHAVQRVMLSIPEGCEEGSICGEMMNIPTRCVWEITYDGFDNGTYEYHFSDSPTGCPIGSAGTLTLQPDGSLYRVHTTPAFTSFGELNKLPNQ